MTNDPELLARRWFEEVWNARREKTVDELLGEGAVGHMEGAEVRGPADFKAVRSALLSAFPDFRVKVEDTVSDGDNVVVRWTAQGTHRGHGVGVDPTDHPVQFRGITWLHFENGQIVEGWDSWNQGALLAELEGVARARALRATNVERRT